jgi:hypothetical protein
MEEFITQEMHRLEDWLGLTLNGFLLASLIELLRYDEHAKGHYVDDVFLAGRAQYQPLAGPFTPHALRLLDPDDAAPLFRLAAVQTDEDLNHTWIGQTLRDRQIALLRAAHQAAQKTFGDHRRSFLDWTRRRFLMEWNGDKKKGPSSRTLADWPEPVRSSFLDTLAITRATLPYKQAQWQRKKRTFYETLWEADEIHWEDNFGFGTPLSFYDRDTKKHILSDLGMSILRFNAYARGLNKSGLWIFAEYADFCESNSWLS